MTTQYSAALSGIERDFRAQLAALSKRYTARMKREAWGDPAKAAVIQAEWDADIDAALKAAREASMVAQKQHIAELPKAQKDEAHHDAN